MTTPVQYSTSGPRITINDVIRDPLMIRARFMSLSENQFVMESVLRRAGGAQGGVVAFEESTPLFAEDDPAVVAEGGEIPLTTGMQGVPRSVRTIKTARGIEITREMRDRGRFDLLNRNMTQVKNTFVRAWDDRFFSAAWNSAMPKMVVGTSWASSEAIRDNIFDGIQLVSEQTSDAQARNYLGFVPDTLILPTSAQYDLLRNVDFSKIYEGGNMADKNIRYTGRLERQIFGLNILISRTMHPDRALLCERNTIGGYSDERPLSVSPTEEDKNRELWRSNVVRRTAVFIDQPKAGCWLTNIAGQGT